jgi:hypothetical protein
MAYFRVSLFGMKSPAVIPTKATTEPSEAPRRTDAGSQCRSRPKMTASSIYLMPRTVINISKQLQITTPAKKTAR